jgi:protein-L-isoaspartate(D-aspartate) O-methyltransferase
MAAGVTDRRVLNAIRRTRRAGFVPAVHTNEAYEDMPIPIAHDQVTTQPSLSAAMVAALDLTGEELVLEIGSGYGYQTALLARLAGQVVSIEIWADMAAVTRRNLAADGVDNVVVKVGDGTEGAPDDGPFDAVIVSAAFPEVPPPLVEQLKVGGRLVQPIGQGGRDDVVLYERRARGLRPTRIITPAHFVRLVGRHGFPRPLSALLGG